MTAQTATEALVTPKASRRIRGGSQGRVQHKGAILFFVAPFVILFLLFYLVPIGYAIWQSLLVVEREGTFGAATEVFGGLAQYVLVFQNEAVLDVGRPGAAVRRRPGAGHARPGAAVRAAAGFRRSCAARSSSASRSSCPTRCPASSPRSCGASSTRRTCRRSPR